MDTDELEELERLLTMDVAELYELAGREVASTVSGFGAAEPTDAEAREQGQQWFATAKETLSERICGSRVYRTYAAAPERYDRALLVAALADLVSGKILGVAPLTAVALSVKVGVDTLCGGTEAADAADE